MSSILKILVDIQCLVYCDLKQVGEALPNSIFKLELRKGTYIIDFRKDDIRLKSIKYRIESDEEDYLLEESLADIYKTGNEAKRRKEISAREVSWIYVGDNWRILSVNDGVLNSITGESWIDLPNNYNLLPMGQHRDPDIDACGYIPFNIGGTLFKDDLTGFFISGGKWGCLDKTGNVVVQPVYGNKVFFQNDQVTSTWNDGVFSGIIDNFGKKVFTEYDRAFPIDEVAGYYDVSQQKKHGIINKYGEIIMPTTYLSFGYHTNMAIWAQDILSKKWGLIRFDSTIVLPFIYDKINKADDGYFVCKNERWGTVDLDGRVIVDTKYRIVAKVSKRYYNHNNPSAYEDIDYLYNNYSIVDIGNNYEGYKYGIVDTHFVEHSMSHTATIAFKEIIPCRYDAIYSKWGKCFREEDLVEAALSQYGYPDGIFEKENVYFVTTKDQMKCDRYNEDNIVAYSFVCDGFNGDYYVLSNKFYLRGADWKFECTPYDKVGVIDFYDGTVHDVYSPPEDYREYGVYEPSFVKVERARISYITAKKDDEWFVINNRKSNVYCVRENSDLTKVLFRTQCDEIIEFGKLISNDYFAIVAIDGCEKLFIMLNDTIVYESDYMKEIHSSYNLLTNCKILNNDNYKVNGLSNDFFVVRLNNDKWQIITYKINYGIEVFKSPEFDNIRFINENIVEIHLYHNGRTLYNTMSSICWDNMRPDSTRWKVSPYEERNCNWVAVYDFDKDKEGIVIEEHDKLSEKEDPIYGGYSIVGKVPEEIIIPCKWDYARVFYSRQNPIIVVGNYSSQKDGNFIDAVNEIKCAVLDTNKRPLSSFIFDKLSVGWSCRDLCFHIGNSFADVNLDKDDLIYAVPFLNYSSYDEEGNRLWGTPFKNVRLFIDTKTTGLPINDNLPYTELDNWPHLVQVALIIEDDNYGILAKRNIILKPNGYIIPESSTQIHGIAHGWAEENGDERDKVISFLDLVLYNSDIIIGHNVSFDLNVIKSEIIRIKGLENSLFNKKKHNVVDTMKLGVNICKIPNPSFYTRNIQSYKYPKLDELYYKLFNNHFDSQHDAMADVQATYDCYYELTRKSE